jgi:surfeit locus 1 family protein
MWKLARTPTWIGGLVFAIAVACGFALLGQWQLSRAVESGTVVERDTETVKQLEKIAKPQQPITEDASGNRVEVSGRYVAGSGSLLEGRLNDGANGYWVMGELRTTADAGLAVALGWTADEAAATSAADAVGEDGAIVELVGRYLPSEDPTMDDFRNGEHRMVSAAALVNTWPELPNGVYSGYVTAAEPAPGLVAIHSPKPDQDVALNWLNVFYAIEWVVFAGLAVFLWYRLLRDAHERALEEAEEAAQLN